MQPIRSIRQGRLIHQVRPIRQVRQIRQIRELGESQTSFRIRIAPADLPDHPALRILRCSPDS